MKHKALFLDRDGIINKDYNYVSEISKFEFIPEIFEICKIFQDKGYILLVITNQSGIGRGYYTESDFHTLNNWMLSKLNERKIYINKVFYCPHHILSKQKKYSIDCNCRKPNPGMFLDAIQEFSLDSANSVLIGDKITDIQAGIKAKIGRNILIPRNEKERYIHEKVTIYNSHTELLQNLNSEAIFKL